MARSRYVGKEVTVQLSTEDFPWEGEITNFFELHGYEMYTIKFDNGEKVDFLFDIIAWIKPKKPIAKKYPPAAKIIPFKLAKDRMLK